MNPSNLLRLSYWFDPALTDAPAGPRMWLVVLAGLLGCILVWVLRQRLGLSRGITASLVLAGVLFAAVGLGRLFAVPVLGWRVGWLVALLVGAVPISLQQLHWAWRSGFANACLRTMAFEPAESKTAVTPVFILFWLGVHIAGLGVVMAFNRWPWWGAALVLGAILLPQALRLIQHKSTQAAPEALAVLSPLLVLAPLVMVAPLVVVYASLAVRLLIGGAHYLVDRRFIVAEPWSTIFNPTLALLVMVGYALVLSVRSWRSGVGTADARFVKLGAAVLVILTLAWSAWTALTLRTRGVSGSDPYAYTQMGVDLATHGTVFHSFPLVRLTYALHIPSEPVVHIGYKLPQDISRTSTTVWPPAYAVFIAAAYLLGGETGVYLLGPVLALLALLIVGWLCLLATQHQAPPLTFAIAALTVFLTATSYQQVEWQLIPMADIGAQVFSLLALGLALRGERGERGVGKGNGMASPLPPSPFPPLLFAALAGVCIGIAFGVRYTQVLIALPVALALMQTTDDRRRTTDDGVVRRLSSVVLCALFAALAAAPTLLYHQAAFGNPFLTGSDELQHFSLITAPATLWRTLQEMFWTREFGLLLPFMLIGVGVAWRYNRPLTLVLALYVGILVGFHALYAYLRQRDLLSVFPVLYGFAALGIVWLVWRVGRGLWKRETTDDRRPTTGRNGRRSSAVRRLCLITLISFTGFTLLQRSIETLILPITRGYDAFGYLVREQRAAFDQLAALTPEDAVIGSSLNSGAIDLHAHRLAFRPAGWNSEQLLAFVDALHTEATPVFILDDGKELVPALQTLRQRFKVVEVGQLDVPYYFPNSGGSENRRVPLYEVKNAPSEMWPCVKTTDPKCERRRVTGPNQGLDASVPAPNESSK